MLYRACTDKWRFKDFCYKCKCSNGDEIW